MENRKIRAAYGRKAPREGYLAGYSWLMKTYALPVPIPRRLALIDGRRGRRIDGEWLLFDDSYRPSDDGYDHLVFALKYEGINLHILKALFTQLGGERVTEMLRREPAGQYARRLWFLYEWLLEEPLDLPELTTRDYHDLVNPSLQYPGPSHNSPRHGIRNNLTGTVDFCPLIHCTDALERCIAMNLHAKAQELTNKIPRDILLRASAYLLLADSRASFAIEGEKPPLNRAQNWARVIGQAGRTPLSRAEFERLQQVIIPRPGPLLELEYRTEEGFIGDRDTQTHAPLPVHISAKAADVDRLMAGLIETAEILGESDLDPVLTAASIAFGFVFIHPFVDGNGRIHRYLFHHMLAKKEFTEAGPVFPISSVILERISEYRNVLEEYSRPRLDLIQWSPDEKYNVAIENDTGDLYRYFDATAQAEFLYDCVRETVETTLPEGIKTLRCHDEMKSWLEEHFEFSDATDTLLISFLGQGEGSFSARARSKEFSLIPAGDLDRIEETYREIFFDQHR
ncbi:MAG: Fic family protein [Bacteroidota bacterium]